MTKDLSIISATKAPNTTAVFEMDMTPMYGSRMGNAQGAAISLIHDMVSSFQDGIALSQTRVSKFPLFAM